MMIFYTEHVHRQLIFSIDKKDSEFPQSNDGFCPNDSYGFW